MQLRLRQEFLHVTITFRRNLGPLVGAPCTSARPLKAGVPVDLQPAKTSLQINSEANNETELTHTNHTVPWFEEYVVYCPSMTEDAIVS